MNFCEFTNNIHLANGDCLKLIEKIDAKVDLLITDPPYNLGLFMKKRNTNLARMRRNHFSAANWDNLEYTHWINNMHVFFEKIQQVMKKRGNLLVFMSLIKIESMINIAEQYGFYYKTTGVWHKTNPMPRNMNIHFVNSLEGWIHFVYKGTSGFFNNKNRLLHDYIETSVTPLKEKKYGKHPTQKPISLIQHFVDILSDEGSVICDPFMGSGTTAVVAKKLGRIFYGIELESHYFDIVKKRLDNENC